MFQDTRRSRRSRDEVEEVSVPDTSAEDEAAARAEEVNYEYVYFVHSITYNIYAATVTEFIGQYVNRSNNILHV